MRRILFRFHRCHRNLIPEGILLLCWFAGSFLGFLTARFYGIAFLPFFELLPGCLPTFGGILASAFFPLLLSAFAVFLFPSFGCFVSAFLRAVSHGLFLGCISGVYGVGAPTMAFLLMFSGMLVNPVLLYFWLRRITLGLDFFMKDLVICGIFSLVIGIADYLVIAPFLVDVINF